MYMWELR